MTVNDKTKERITVRLTPGGSMHGRLVSEDGEPITDATLSARIDASDSATWPPHPALVSNPTQIPVDKNGSFRIDGLVPGKRYPARVSALRKKNGEMFQTSIGTVFDDVQIEAGKTLDLGDVLVTNEEPMRKKEKPKKNAAKANDAEKISTEQRRVTIRGRVTGTGGKPSIGAKIAVIGTASRVARGGDLAYGDEVLAESRTDSNGNYVLSILGLSSKSHRRAALVASDTASGLACANCSWMSTISTRPSS